MEQNYALEYLDLLITTALNPDKTDVSTLTDQQIQDIEVNVQLERKRLEPLLKNQVFRLTKKKQIIVLVKQYHSALIILLDQALENQKLTHAKASFYSLCSDLISCLERLLSFIEIWFCPYLGLDERVPPTYLFNSKNELRQRLNKCKDWLVERVDDSRLTDIVLNTLYSFTNDPDSDHMTTFRELCYRKELVKQLETLKDFEKSVPIYTALNELLIYMDFNSKAYLDYYTAHLSEKINAQIADTDRMDLLLLYSKEFNQMQRKEGAILLQEHAGLKAALNNWFRQEIFYLEKKLHLNIAPLNANVVHATTQKNGERQKILCKLSVDQIALILRSVNDLKIILANSMNSLFKSIVPYLSTPNQVDISYDSMRSKSYAAEIRDKEVAIQLLEQMIKKIQEY